MKIYLNGSTIEESLARIPLMDRGVLFGDGLFETLRAYSGRPFRLGEHLDRLREGCQRLRISGIPGDDEFSEAIRELYGTNVEEGDAYVRITVTGGLHDGSKTLVRPSQPNVFVVVQPYEGYPDEYYSRGIRLTFSNIRRNPSSPLSRLKTNNYLDSLVAKQEAKDRGADDAVMLNCDGYVAEGTSSNIFVVSGGAVVTPGAECGLLPGITRGVVMELCGVLSINCRAAVISPENLLESDEAFLTLSTGEIVPVAEVDGSQIGAMCPGAVTSQLTTAYRSLVRVELGLGDDG